MLGMDVFHRFLLRTSAALYATATLPGQVARDPNARASCWR
jgi:hypothetical protein